MARSTWAVTWSVWRALFIREAMYRLYGRRAAWVWLFLEPAGYIGFLLFIFTVVSAHVMGGIDSAIWTMTGILGFFMFRRTMNVGMGAVFMSKPLFTYRQVRPVDAVLVRAVAEGLLMFVIILVLLGVAALFGVDVWPDQPLTALGTLLVLWMLGLGMGMVLSVPREFVSETENLVNLVMTPLFLASGIFIPIASIPQPYRDWLLLNPVGHALDILRLGFASHYQILPEINLGFPVAVALASIFLGLMLHRVYQTRLIQQ